MSVYLACFPGITYNCEKSFYSLASLPESVISKGVIFAYKGLSTSATKNMANLAVALKTKTELDDKNRYKTIERLNNLICLAYTSFSNEQQLQNNYKDIENVIKDNLSDNFYDPNTRYGKQLSWDLPLRVAAYSYKVNDLLEKDREKFWSSLQTFCYARQIAYLPNPQYKYTLYMTLHLASINQLADDPQNLHKPLVNLVCPECKKEVNIPHQTSHVVEIVKLIKELIPKEHQDRYIKFIKDLFHPIRSRFIHNGSFAGKEDFGGFISLWGEDFTLTENDINLMVFNRFLLEQFLEKRSRQCP